MPKFLKFETDAILHYACINDENVLLARTDKLQSYPASKIRFLPSTSLKICTMEEYEASYQHLTATEIKEPEFLNAVGDVQGAIKYFIDKTIID